MEALEKTTRRSRDAVAAEVASAMGISCVQGCSVCVWVCECVCERGVCVRDELVWSQ